MLSCDPKNISQEKQFGPKCNPIFSCKINTHIFSHVQVSFFDACNAEMKYYSSHKIILKFRKLKHDYVVSYKLTLSYDLLKSLLLYIFLFYFLTILLFFLFCFYLPFTISTFKDNVSLKREGRGGVTNAVQFWDPM